MIKHSLNARTSPSWMRISMAALTLFLLVSLAAQQNAMAQVMDPTIVSDKADYYPGELVTLTGQNWQRDERVSLVVDDDYNDPWILQTDPEVDPYIATDGSFVFQFNLPSWFIASYTATATGLTTGRVATTTFTDSAPPGVENLWQCDPPTPYDQSTFDCEFSPFTGWIVGNNNGLFWEGDTVPYRTRFRFLEVGNQYSLTIGWDSTKAFKHVFDYLRSLDNTILQADACISLTNLPAGLCNSITSTYLIPQDGVMQAEDDWTGSQLSGNFIMYGGEITSLSAYDHLVTFEGDASTAITIYFTANSPDVVLAWGGHIASRENWTLGNLAVYITGSPFHMRLVEFFDVTDDKVLSLANTERSLTADAVIYPATITVVKEANPEGATNFRFTGDLGEFSLVDDGNPAAPVNTFTTEVDIFGDYSITEIVPESWILDSVVCSDTSGNPAWNGSGTITVNVAEGDVITCTFYNSQNKGRIVIVKDAVPNDPQDFSFTLTGQTLFYLDDDADLTLPSSRSFIVPGGIYNAIESLPVTGWTLTGLACVDPSSNTTVNLGTRTAAINLAVGETVTCTFTNSKQGKIVVDKVTLPPGSPVAFDFDPSWSTSNFTLKDLDKPYEVLLLPGAYNVIELPESGWILTQVTCLSSLSDNEVNTNIELDAGETVTCTFTNTQEGALQITKLVDWNDNVPDATKTFTICILGPSFPSGDCKEFDFDGEVKSWLHLKPGVYSFWELNPNTGGSDWWDTTYTPYSQLVTVPVDGTGYGEVFNENAILTAITLEYFKVDWALFPQVQLSWATIKEIDTLGFKLYRSSTSDSSGAVELVFIPQATPEPDGERIYQFMDGSIPACGRYYYWLLEISTSGVAKTLIEMIDPLSVSVFSSYYYLPGVSKY